MTTTKDPTNKKKKKSNVAANRPEEELDLKSSVGKRTRTTRPEEPGQRRFSNIPISAIKEISPVQTRKSFDPENDEVDKSFVGSVTRVGVHTPISVVNLGGRPIDYRLIFGWRRYQAALHLGFEKIPAQIYSSEEDAIFFDLQTLSENAQRKNLNPIEEARMAKKFLRKHPKQTQADVAGALGKSQPHVSKLFELLKVSKKIQDLLEVGTVGVNTGYALSKLKPEEQDTAIEAIEKGIDSAGAIQIATEKQNKSSKKPTKSSVKDSKENGDQTGLRKRLIHALVDKPNKELKEKLEDADSDQSALYLAGLYKTSKNESEAMKKFTGTSYTVRKKIESVIKALEKVMLLEDFAPDDVAISLEAVKEIVIAFNKGDGA